MIFVGVLSPAGRLHAAPRPRRHPRRPGAHAPPAQALIAIHNWTFLVGPGIMPAVNALCLATVMYRSRLVPRIIPTVGLIGAPLLLASSVATLFGAWDQVSGPAFLLALPIAAWEFSLGIYLTVKGVRSSSEDAGPTQADGHRVLAGAAV